MKLEAEIVNRNHFWFKLQVRCDLSESREHFFVFFCIFTITKLSLSPTFSCFVIKFTLSCTAFTPYYHAIWFTTGQQQNEFFTFSFTKTLLISNQILNATRWNFISIRLVGGSRLLPCSRYFSTIHSRKQLFPHVNEMCSWVESRQLNQIICIF